MVVGLKTTKGHKDRRGVIEGGTVLLFNNSENSLNGRNTLRIMHLST